MTDVAAPPRGRALLLRLLQVAVIAAAVWFLWRLATTHQADLGRVRLEPRWPALLAASAIWFASFALLVATWTRSLGWWSQRLRLAAGLRIFFLSNLARYVPGALWQFAGLAAMSRRQGVPAAAATSAVLIQQATLLLTGVALAVVLAPEYLAPLAARSGLAVPGTTARIAIAATGVALTILLAPRVLPVLRQLARRWMPDAALVPSVTSWAFARYAAATTLGWAGYGVAFAVFARALLGAEAPSVSLAAATWVAAYVAGIVWIFVPGGLGIRESALVIGLAPAIGYDRAIVLAIASRIWLVILEILGAVASLREPRGEGAPSRAR